jgi:ribonuclease P protein component
MASRITLTRRHSFSGKNNLDWFFANRKWIRTSSLSVTECAWAIRPLPNADAGIRFLLLASKRSYKRAHDRNKIRRWIRAAIMQVEDFAEMEKMLEKESQQLLVMLRISKPLADLKWNIVAQDVFKIEEHLKRRIEKLH